MKQVIIYLIMPVLIYLISESHEPIKINNLKEQKLILNLSNINNCNIPCDSILWPLWKSINIFKYEANFTRGKVTIDLDPNSGTINTILNPITLSINNPYKPISLPPMPIGWMPGNNITKLIYKIDLSNIRQPDDLLLFVGSFPNEGFFSRPNYGKLRFFDRSGNRLNTDKVCLLFEDRLNQVAVPTEIINNSNEILLNAQGSPQFNHGSMLVFKDLPMSTSLIEVEHNNDLSRSDDGVFLNIGSPNCCLINNKSIDTTFCSEFIFRNKIYKNSGKYFDTIKNSSGCDTIISLNISKYIATKLTIPDTSFCSNFIYNLTAANGFLNYEWSNGIKGLNGMFSTFGEHWLCVNDSCGIRICDTFNIRNIPSFGIESSMDTTIKIGDFIQLFVKILPNSNMTLYKYEWKPKRGLSCDNCPNPIANPKSTQKYKVVVTDLSSGCSNEACVTLKTECCIVK